MQTQYRITAKSPQRHEFARSSPSPVLIAHRAYLSKRGVFRGKSCRTTQSDFHYLKGDVPYGSARLAFELKTASVAPAAMKREGFLPAAARPRLSRMLTGLCLSASSATASCSAGECSAARADELSGHGSAMIQQGGGSR